MKMKAEIVKVTKTSIICQGRDVPYDHPRIYLKIDPKKGQVTCPYCSRKFALEV